MKEWERIIEQKPTEAHDNHVLSSMDALLEQNAELAKGAKQSRSVSWLFWLAPASSVFAALVFFLATGNPFGKRAELAQQAADATPMLEIAMDYELLADLQEIRYLDELQKLEDLKKWKTGKSKTRKL